jgi:transcription termination factor Rho
MVEKTRGGLRLAGIESVGGLPPEAFKKRKPYSELVAVNPTERFNLSAGGTPSMRSVDLIAPIGKGTRGLIVSPPKAGKTTMLKDIANGIAAHNPGIRVIVLLIDERPEEVTYFRRGVKAEVVSSSMDQSLEEHIELAELMLAHIRTELECGRDIVVLLDSITRMGRAFNRAEKGNGRVMSGGLGAGALEIPRRFFGMARNVEGGGSVTIIGTCLVDTGSRMDQLIFEEFKGTGNSEIILDRRLAEARIFPAVDIPASGTRREEDLYTAEEMRAVTTIRRVLTSYNSVEAMQAMHKLLQKYPTNELLLKSIGAGRLQ